MHWKTKRGIRRPKEADNAKGGWQCIERPKEADNASEDQKRLTMHCLAFKCHLMYSIALIFHYKTTNALVSIVISYDHL
jgi:hypothetical protein